MAGRVQVNFNLFFCQAGDICELWKAKKLHIGSKLKSDKVKSFHFSQPYGGTTAHAR